MPNLRSILYQTIGLTLLLTVSSLDASAQGDGLAESYKFLVSDRAQGGVLYKATAGKLQGLSLPLSYVDSSEYWGEYVCRQQHSECAVMDVYNMFTYTLTPQQNSAGKLQTERVNVHSGTNIYDAATWQIAVVLGQTINHFISNNNEDAYTLANNQNKLLKVSYSGNAPDPVQDTNRATSKGSNFIYNHHLLSSGEQAYSFRMIPRSWITDDPFKNTQYESLITMTELPKNAPAFQRGNVTWTDWKPLTGENAWAFLLGPLHAAYIHFIESERQQYIPFDDLSVQNALAILPTFAAMQSSLGGVYYAPAGTIGNQEDQLVNPHQVSIENNASLYAGLRVLESTLRAEFKYEKELNGASKTKINAALDIIRIMIDGGQVAQNNATVGLLSFFRNQAWRNNEFVQGGLANEASSQNAWIPTTKPRAIDANTWSIAALGAARIDQWFGFGASFNNWQQIKRWGGYGVNKKLWGVGYSDEDGNGMNNDGTYRQGILSAEWTAGAINMVRSLINYYEHISIDSTNYHHSQTYVRSLKEDESAMFQALQTLRIDNYDETNFPGKPHSYNHLIRQSSKPYLYASKRYLIPFGWYSNPLPSTCATAWMIMVTDRYDPFVYGGKSLTR